MYFTFDYLSEAQRITAVNSFAEEIVRWIKCNILSVQLSLGIPIGIVKHISPSNEY